MHSPYPPIWQKIARNAFTFTALPLKCCAVAQLRSRQVVSAFFTPTFALSLIFAAYGGDKRSAA